MGRNRVMANRRWPTMVAVFLAGAASVATSRPKGSGFESPNTEEPRSLSVTAERPAASGRFTVDVPLNAAYEVTAHVEATVRMSAEGEDIPSVVRASLWSLQGSEMKESGHRNVALRPGGERHFGLSMSIPTPEKPSPRVVVPMELRLEWLQPQLATVETEFVVKGSFFSMEQPFPVDTAGLDVVVVHLPDEPEPEAPEPVEPESEPPADAAAESPPGA
ncbi:MAG: hypothetical protein AAF799_16320 [Myxococcota bacterium]